MAALLDKDPAQNQPSALVPEVSEVYAQFAGLIAHAKQHFSGELSGKLLLYGQIDASGASLALAASIAGAASLGIDSDPERLRQSIRHGFCDFAVNSLDEALRILKNEVRKKQPVAVCLEADLAATLREAAERGLQPDLLALPEDADRSAFEILVERGAIVVAEIVSDRDRRSVARPVSWTADSAPARWLPKVDGLAASVLPEGDYRAQWLKLAPRYLGRMIAAQHFLPMTAEESERFAEIVDAALASGEIGAKIKIQR